MSKTATKTPPKGPQYSFHHTVFRSTSLHGLKIPTVSMTTKPKKTPIAKKLIISKIPAKYIEIITSPTLYLSLKSRSLTQTESTMTIILVL